MINSCKIGVAVLISYRKCNFKHDHLHLLRKRVYLLLGFQINMPQLMFKLLPDRNLTYLNDFNVQFSHRVAYTLVS